MVIKCPNCDKNDFKSVRGLNCHISRIHPSSADGRGLRPSTDTRGRRDDKDIVVKDITCPFCDKNDFKSERGLSCHITRMHRSSSDGKGPRPSTGTRDRKDDRDGARPETLTPRHEDHERHNSDRDVVKGIAKVQRDSLQKGSPDNILLKDGARPETLTPRHEDHERHNSDRDVVKGVAKVQRESLQRGSPGNILLKNDAVGAKPESRPAKYKESPKQSRTTEEPHDRPLSSLSNFILSFNAPNFEKFVKMIEGSIVRPREDSTLRTESVNKFIDDLKVVMERISDIPLKLLKSGSYYDKTKIDYNNEFDFMFYADIKMEADFTNCPPGYCKIRKGVTVNKDLDPFIDRNGYLVPKLYKSHMFDIFEKCRTDPSFRKGRRTQLQDRKPESPAYTLLFDLGIPDKSPIDIDLVPAIRISGWPKTKDAREIQTGKWIDISTAKKAMECFHVVTKQFPEAHPDTNLLWRVSFSHAEKELILHADLSDKGCRKNVFKILKKIKENMKSKNPTEMDKFCSYHLKMFILGFYDTHSDFSKDQKLDMLKKGIEQLAKCVREGAIENYFIPKDNVLQSVPEEERRYVVRELEGLLQ
uniref:Cyclic GMP-AMP synthase-like receptor n=2 Tax=Magallana gigas TaxID=29159 RepID=CGLR_MAGGI|nr:cyclic GMP-AMP synthase isoform X2 [Crassostrea gigas]XP_011418944.2 cyclic GMP-AMP synthase isoform X2 [Crassostrea gigas]XP_034310227.1 cyclic GMP-AMP synthase isoform X2 [Crassostrea gigas]